VVATALTAIHRHLGSSLADLEWTVNAYTLSFAVLLMTAAAIGDRLGRRRVFAAGLAVFAVSSAACALAPDTAALIAARAVQGAGRAATSNTPPADIGRASGAYATMRQLGGAFGIAIAGAAFAAAGSYRSAAAFSGGFTAACAACAALAMAGVATATALPGPGNRQAPAAPVSPAAASAARGGR